MNQFKLKEDLLWVGVSTLVTAILWIVYAIYNAFAQITTDPEVQSLLKPLNPVLDHQVLSQLDDYYRPPDDYTILVKKSVDESFVIVPLGTSVSDPPPEINPETTPIDETQVPTPEPTPSSF
jgi:hypothetical protein